MKKLIRLAAVAAAFVLHLYAPAEAAPVTSNVQIPLAGTIFVPLSDGSFDQVPLSGMVHVGTYFAPDGPPGQPPLRIQINLDQVFGFGDVTGFRYNATGANRVNLASRPTDPMNLGFNLEAMVRLNNRRTRSSRWISRSSSVSIRTRASC